jgi:diadenosine tetraphosphatase ApaH/serine/threonine PP2A family protein phosphatase
VDRVEDAQLVLSDVAASEPDVRMVIVGHTHRWMAYGERAGALPTHPGASLEIDGDARVLLNAGSVGQSRQRTARARFIVVDLAAGTVTFDEVRYDVAAARRALRRVGLSPRGVHLYSSPPRRAAAHARRLLARPRS